MAIYETFQKKTIPPEGPQAAVCVEVREFVRAERSDYSDPTSPLVEKQKVQYLFESPGGGISESKVFNAKWGPKSRHYQFVQDWFGGKPPVRYDSKAQVGRWGKVNVEHKQGDKVTFANVISIKPADPAAVPADYTPLYGSEGDEESVPF